MTEYTELIDVLDENGKETGMQETIGNVHRDGLYHRTAKVWILNSKQELLLQKRSPDSWRQAGKWDASAGRHTSSGKTNVETCIEEAREEIGIILKEKDLQYVFTYLYKTDDGDYHNREFTSVYLVEKNVSLSEVSFEDGEVSDVRYLDFREFEKRFIEKNRSFVQVQEEYPRLFKALHRRFD